MTSVNTVVLILVAAIGLMVVMKLFYVKSSNRNESTSNTLMQLRVFMQAIIVGAILLVLWLMGGATELDVSMRRGVTHWGG
jgi:ABC-type amino acid transport system permease subunit